MANKLLARLGRAALTIPLVASDRLLRLFGKRMAGERPSVRPPSSSAASSTGPRRQRLSSADMRAMLVELRGVLDARDDARATFRHLNRFERQFSKTGARAIDQVPIDDLRRALRDFEALVRNWSSPPLASLRSRMAVTLADRSSAASVWVAANSVSAVFRPGPPSLSMRLARGAASMFRPSQAMETNEVGISRFEAAGGQWRSGSGRGTST